MNSDRASGLFKKYAASVVYLEVELPNGDRSIGSGFHVGEGVFVTARHVLEGNKLLSIGSTVDAYIPLAGAEAKNAMVVVAGDERTPVHHVRARAFDVADGPYFHTGPDVDVAVLRVEEIDPRTPVVPLGGHLDDWLGQTDFVMSDTVILGYPPIPMTLEPQLVGARAEVNALIDRRDRPHVHFVISAMPRGGFSGGLVLLDSGHALGVITDSLMTDGNPSELGFMAVVGVEPIYACLAENKMLPESQAEGWDDLWTSS